jgi:sugar/nucleoside kinase (ribokinase family)
MGLVIVGSVALDSVKTPFGSVEDALGGSANYAAMASKNFCDTKIVGVVGSDYPTDYIELLKHNGVNVEGLEVKPGKTFRWRGVYNDLNRVETLDTQLNVFAEFDPILPADYRSSKYLFLGNIHPALQLNVLQQMPDVVVSACDTMNFWIEGNREELLEVIKRVTILFINQDEIKMLTGEENIFKAADIVAEMGPELIVVKRGEYGALAVHKDYYFFTPIYPVKDVVDPTGAGDSFAGGFMGYIAGKNSLQEDIVKKAMVHGTVMASFDVESFSLERLKDANMANISYRKEEIRRSVWFK